MAKKRSNRSETYYRKILPGDIVLIRRYKGRWDGIDHYDVRPAKVVQNDHDHKYMVIELELELDPHFYLYPFIYIPFKDIVKVLITAEELERLSHV